MKQSDVAHHSYRVCDYFGGVPNNTKGEVGLELETIGKRLPTSFQKTKLWSIHPDNSIKPRSGEVTAEYVFSQPVGRAKVEQALDELLDEFKTVKAEVAEDRVSNSVHVHVNAQQLTIQQVYTWLTLYFIFEELLVRWAGKHREGNLFCLRARDAEGLIKMLARSARGDDFHEFMESTNSASYRYAAVNVMSLAKFGSIEFRALRGTANKQVITDWVQTLLAIKDASLNYKNPIEVLADFSRRSPLGFTNITIPGELRTFMFKQPDFQDSLYDGMRLAQDFAFSTTWKNTIREKKAETPKKPKVAFHEGVSFTTQFFQDLDQAAAVSFSDDLATPGAHPAAPPYPRQWTGFKHTSNGKISRFLQPEAGFSQMTTVSIHDGLWSALCLANNIQNYRVTWAVVDGYQYLVLQSRGTVTSPWTFVRFINHTEYTVVT